MLISLIPAVLAVLSQTLSTPDVHMTERQEHSRISFRGLGGQCTICILIVALFDLGNAADAFLVVRTKERGLSIVGVRDLPASLIAGAPWQGLRA